MSWVNELCWRHFKRTCSNLSKETKAYYPSKATCGTYYLWDKNTCTSWHEVEGKLHEVMRIKTILAIFQVQHKEGFVVFLWPQCVSSKLYSTWKQWFIAAGWTCHNLQLAYSKSHATLLLKPNGVVFTVMWNEEKIVQIFQFDSLWTPNTNNPLSRLS